MRAPSRFSGLTGPTAAALLLAALLAGPALAQETPSLSDGASEGPAMAAPLPPPLPTQPQPSQPQPPQPRPSPAAPAGAPLNAAPAVTPAPLGGQSETRPPDLVFDTAILQGMDKVTGRVMTIEAPVGSTVHYGTLEIIVRTCRKRPPEETPEAAAFLDIWEVRNGAAAESLFRGWMFASSPALSALEHPVYDIWVLDCLNSSDKASSAPKAP
ncbi:hypothetical protein GALL_304950 [mine drainage metagenome]|uniref:DUF2155 domain-containing protein n=1 Tax=mine drainage metagenome TaxID=410659 RepID=A0A1J5R6H0_9ZZZZ